MKNVRNKAWRQAQHKSKEVKKQHKRYKKFVSEKNWKLMYLRSEKLKRARQLGIDYPNKTLRQTLDSEMPLEEGKLIKILFICSRNQWRSPTGEQVWKAHPQISTRSAGTSPKARRTVTVKDIQWAEIIFVMEQKHKSRLQAQFTRLLDFKNIYVLDIPDEYQYMDRELIEILKQSVGSHLGITAC